MTHGTNTSEKFWVFDGMSDEYVDALLRGWLEKARGPASVAP